MNVITKISCYLERSVVTLKLRKEYLNTVTYNTPVLLGSYKLSKNSPFFGPPCTYLLTDLLCRQVDSQVLG